MGPGRKRGTARKACPAMMWMTSLLLRGGPAGLLPGGEAEVAGHADAERLALGPRSQLAVHQAVDQALLIHGGSPFRFQLGSLVPSTLISDKHPRGRTP